MIVLLELDCSVQVERMVRQGVGKRLTEKRYFPAKSLTESWQAPFRRYVGAGLAVGEAQLGNQGIKVRVAPELDEKRVRRNADRLAIASLHGCTQLRDGGSPIAEPGVDRREDQSGDALVRGARSPVR